MTLAFLGNIPDESCAPIAKAIESAVESTRAFDVVIGPGTTLLGRSVLCLPVRGWGLEQLAEAVRSAALGPDERGAPERFFGHLTLARSAHRGRIPGELVGRSLSASWWIGEIHLVRSVAGPDGSSYDSVAVIPLKP